jgi:hypothetical protein
MGFRSSKVSPSAASPYLSAGLPAWRSLNRFPLRSRRNLARLPGFSLRGSPLHSRRRSPGSARSSLELFPSRGPSTFDGPGHPGLLLPRAWRSGGGEPLPFAAPRSFDRGGLELPGRNSAPPGVLHLAGSVRFFDLSPSRAHGFASADPIASAACDVSSPGGPRPGTPRRERSRLKGQEGHRPGGFRPVEGRRLRKPWRGRSPGRQGSEVARACALRSSFPFPVGVILWSRGRNSSEGRGNGRRGEAPRGAPPAGRSKALKGAIPRALRWPRAAARRGGEQTVERVLEFPKI